MTGEDQFEDIFELAIETAGQLFESTGVELDPNGGPDLVDLVEACQSAQDAGSTHGVGDIIAVSPHQPHALRTEDSAVLVLYTWTGPDISFDTYQLD